MKRSIVIFSVLFSLLSSGVLLADDAQDIRDLIIRENVSFKKADINAIVSCYSTNPAIYWQITDDPEDILLYVNGEKELRSIYAAAAKKQNNVEPTCEVRHVSIRGDKAVAVTRHWKTVNNYPMGTHHSMWMLTKTGGKWLITSAIVVKSDLPDVLQRYAPKQ
jgi:hypothetical protein